MEVSILAHCKLDIKLLMPGYILEQFQVSICCMFKIPRFNFAMNNINESVSIYNPKNNLFLSFWCSPYFFASFWRLAPELFKTILFLNLCDNTNNLRYFFFFFEIMCSAYQQRCYFAFISFEIQREPTRT